MRRRLPLLLALPVTVALALAVPAARAADASDAWRAARWDMDAEALRQAVPGLTETDLEYGAGLTGAFVLPHASIGGLVFRAVFQMDADGLRQILFEKRRREIAPGDGPSLYLALRESFGEEDRLCLSPDTAEAWSEAAWILPDGVLRLVLSDFSDPEIYTSNGADPLYPLPGPMRDLLRDLHFLTPAYRAGGPEPQALPRRLLLRWTDPEAIRLDSPRCPVQGPDPAD